MTYQDKLKKFTFLIPIFDLKDDRFDNFKFVLSKIKEVTDRILVVEQVRDNKATQSRQFTESLGIDYFSVKINDDFIHKSKLINLGTNEIHTEYVWVNDADCYLKFQKVIDLLDFRHNFIQPYSVGKYIEKEETDKIFKGEAVDIKFNYSKLHEKGQHIIPGTLYYTAMYGALSFIYSKQAFKAIGRMNEMYTGWGLEDNSLCMRMFQYKNLKFDIVNLPGIHLYHPRGDYAEKLSCEKTKYNLEIYQEEFGKKPNDLHALTRLYYENHLNSKRIAIIGVERSGTNMLLYALTTILKLTPHPEPFNESSTRDLYIPPFNSVDDYFNFYYKKNNFCLKHIHSEEYITDRFNLPKIAVSEKIILNCDKIIITTRKNFIDWMTSFALAHYEANWLDGPYYSNIEITREYFDDLYNKWNQYHNTDLSYLIDTCKKHKKTYKILDYDDLVGTFGNFADLNIDLNYHDILHHATIKKQKTHKNQQYIKNYGEVLNWFNNAKNSL